MFHSGYVAIVGLPNVGKSTFLNQVLGEKLTAVTAKPQTTRHKILGILTRAQGQILFLDTPGIHRSKKLLNEQIVRVAHQAIEESDMVLHMILPRLPLSDLDQQIQQEIQKLSKPHFVLINQIDRVEKSQLLPLFQKIQELWHPDQIFPICAQSGEGCETVLQQVEQVLPEGPAYYDHETYTELPVRFLCEEIVREQAMNLLHQEIPYALTALTEQFDEQDRLVRIHMALIVEKNSQKAMVIGKGGNMIKKIGELARPSLEKLVQKKVYLKLFVKVVEAWTKSPKRLKEFGIY